MDVIENRDDVASRFSKWGIREDLKGYTWVENRHAPFTPLKRALPLLNLGLISSAGAYINGTEPFDLESRHGDLNYREIPIEVGASDMRYAAKGYDPTDVTADRNCQVPIDRLLEYQANAVIGQLNNVWWSLSPFIANAVSVAEEMAPALAERLKRYEAHAALLIPASPLCHQTLGIIARVIEQTGIPTMVLSVSRELSDRVRAPRSAYYDGEFGSVAGKPKWREYQLRVLDESIRWIETFDQPGTRKLAVDIQTQVEAARGER